jgi:hypothetical protein
MPQEKNKIEKFWSWFNKNNKKFINIMEEDRAKRDELIDEILENLHKYCGNIWIQVGGDSKEYTELIFTVEGNSNYYQKVKDLIADAPSIEGWKAIGLVPPMEIEGINYDDLEIAVTDLAYRPILNFEDVNAISLSIFVKDYESKNCYPCFETAVHKLLDLILGEECYGYVSTVDFEEWQDDMESNILGLRNYILTKKGI